MFQRTAPTTPPRPDSSPSRRTSIASSSSTVSEKMTAEQSTLSLLNSEVSVTKIMNTLLAVPANRSCADCRSPLLDSSQVHASLSPAVVSGGRLFHHHEHRSKSDCGNFFAKHQAFAPPGHQRKPSKPEDVFIDPAIIAAESVGGHGVFLCAMCGAAHKILGTKIAIVHSVHDATAWTRDEVRWLIERGGNERSWQVLEAYMPESWQKAYRPNNKSSLSARETFCRAKYEALAFVLPPTGPRASRAWFSLVQKHQELQRWAKGELGSMYKLTLPEMRSAKSSAESTDKLVLPSRLVDFFCVVGCSKRLERHEVKRDLSKVSSPQDLYLETKVLDCFPDQGFYDDTEFPDHLFSIVLPDGCRPRPTQTPTFFTFVLTEANGVCLYGATLHIYDEAFETQQLKNVLLDSGYEGALPPWLEDPASLPAAEQPPEILFLPKCLVVLSHYPFFDLWRKFLLKLYRITLVEAPLPVERYIANFVCEIPLPPQGHIEIRCGFTNDDNWIVSRPAPNQLPLANFSFKPLFASLSVGNVMLVTALLMQETQVALVSQHYALLGVVAESLLTLLFPFQWLGLYAPCVPSRAMCDILEAPVPFLVGLHASYLNLTKPKHRPKGVVFVDLDRDVVHLGFDPETKAPRTVPCIPERDAAKLKSKLEEYGGGVYLAPDSGWKGSITTGNGARVASGNSDAYAQMSLLDLSACKIRRKDVLGRLDKAFPDNEDLTEMGDFSSEHGQLKEREETRPSDPATTTTGKGVPLGFLRRLRVGAFHSDDPKSQVECKNLLDMEEPSGFSSEEIRKAYLRFFVTIFQNYATFLRPGATFDTEAFLSDLNLSPGSGQFVRSVLGTQMFQHFLEDRRANPNDPHFRFFDESIVAKHNRSKRTTIALGGKKGTPFLDDTSAKITDTFTPPPPSNWGLPDDGKGYTYKCFPSLNRDLVGKVRQPKHFTQHRSSISRKPLAASLSQTKFLNGSPSFTPATFSSPDHVSKRQVADLESAIKTLAKVHEPRPVTVLEGLGQAGLSKKSSWGTESFESVMLPSAIDHAEDFVLCARRKQGVLLSFVVELQSYCRMLRTKRQYQLFRKSIIALQRKFRDQPKVERAKLQLLHRLQKAVLLQKNLRALVVRQRFKEKVQAIRNVQRWLRGVIKRQMFRRLRRCVTSIQAHARGRRVRFALYLLSNLITTAQARIRGFQTRRRFRFVMDARMERYKNQVFLLWQHAHTPLSYRTTFWYIFRDCTYLNLNLVEDELYRLWDELQISVSPQAMQIERLSTKVLVAGEKLGLQNKTWQQFLLVESMLSGKSSKDFAFPAESKPVIASAAGREQAERLQLYERLRRCNNQELLNRAYRKFNIPANQKLKKKCLSVAVFATFDSVEQSVFVMKSFFPELEGSANITWIPPSKRGFKRLGMMLSNFIPLEKSTWIQKRIEGRIRSDLKQMAASLLSGRVFQLIVKLDAREQRRLTTFERQQEAMSACLDFPNWFLYRRNFLQGLIIPFLRVHASGPRVIGARSDKRKKSQPVTGKVASVGVNVVDTSHGKSSEAAAVPADPFASVEVVLVPASSKPIFPDEAFASIGAVQETFPSEAYKLLGN